MYSRFSVWVGNAHTHARTHVYASVFMYVRMAVHMSMHMSAHMPIHISVHTSVKGNVYSRHMPHLHAASVTPQIECLSSAADLLTSVVGP